MEQRNAKAEIPPNGMEISRLLTENSLMREELTRTKRALEMATKALMVYADPADDYDGRKLASDALADIKQEIGE